MKKLNLGCGKLLRKGCVNLDSVKLPGVDVVHNLNKYPWPFKGSTFDEIHCDNVLEHLEDIKKPLEEIWRISKNKGRIIIRVPIFPSIWAFSDPTHKSVYTFVTFNYFTPQDGLNYYSHARFKIIKRRIVFYHLTKFLNPIVNCCESMQKLYSFYFSSIIPANSLYFELECIK